MVLALNTSDAVRGTPRMFMTSKIRCAPARSSVVTMTRVTSLTRYDANARRSCVGIFASSSNTCLVLMAMLRCACDSISLSRRSNSPSRSPSCTYMRKKLVSRSRSLRRGSALMPRSLSPGSTMRSLRLSTSSGSSSRSRSTEMMMESEMRRCCPSMTWYLVCPSWTRISDPRKYGVSGSWHASCRSVTSCAMFSVCQVYARWNDGITNR